MEINGFYIRALADLHGANLRGADLHGADLREANLREADLHKTYLRGANLRGANLREADLHEANLREADLHKTYLRGANLRGADLRGANLRGAYLHGANLREADLHEANLRGANLYEADLHEANLRGAYLRGVYLYKAQNIPSLIAAQLSIVPSTGSFEGWKKAGNCLVHLLIPGDAKRSNATGRKCRASHVKVLKIYGEGKAVTNTYGPVTKYREGEIVQADSWDDEDRWKKCSNGIHFFLTREEAEDWL